MMEQMQVIAGYTTEELCDHLSRDVHQNGALEKLREHDDGFSSV